MLRVPVVDKEGKPLMPTKPSRARRWLREGKAIKRWSDLGVFYVQVTVDPSDIETQPVVVGIDPGKLYSGIGVQSSKSTLFMAHLVLPFETVKKRMEQRRVMRRTRRSRRINRKVRFKLRNHRQKRFDNRAGHKLPPSIRANRQLELRVVRELAAIFPVSEIVWEYVKADVDLTSGRKGARSGRGFSPVMVGQIWALNQLGEIAPVSTQLGWQTAILRQQLRLVKTKNKSEQTPQSHAVDGVALACSAFLSYQRVQTTNGHGHVWRGSVSVTSAPFRVLRRPPYSRRQLHLMVPAKGGIRRKYGGTTTPFPFRKGDLVGYKDIIGYCSGFTGNSLSVSDQDWRRLGRFASTKTVLVSRSNNLLSSGHRTPQPALLSPIPPSCAVAGVPRRF